MFSTTRGLRGAAAAAGVAAVVLEIGVALTVDVEQVETAVEGIFTLMRRVGMLERKGLKLLEPEPTYFHSEWIRAERGGIFINELALGARVKEGDKIAEIINPVSSEAEIARSGYW